MGNEDRESNEYQNKKGYSRRIRHQKKGDTSCKRIVDLDDNELSSTQKKVQEVNKRSMDDR